MQRIFEGPAHERLRELVPRRVLPALAVAVALIFGLAVPASPAAAQTNEEATPATNSVRGNHGPTICTYISLDCDEDYIPADHPLFGVVPPLETIGPNPLVATEQELEELRDQVQANRDSSVDELERRIADRLERDEHNDALERHIDEVRRWRYTSMRRPPGAADVDDVDCSRPENGYLPACNPDCEGYGKSLPYSVNYDPRCNPDCYWNWVAGNFIEGFAGGAAPECRSNWNPLNDCDAIERRLNAGDFAVPPMTDAELIRWLTCSNNPHYNRQAEPQPLNITDICVNLSAELRSLVTAFDRIDHQTWENNPQTTPRNRDKLWNNRAQLDGSVDVANRLTKEFEAAAVEIQTWMTMSFPETADLGEVLTRYLEGDATAISAFEDLIPDDMLAGYGNGEVSPLDAFVEQWTMETIGALGRGRGLPSYTLGPSGTINTNLVMGDVRNWPSVLRDLCEYREELEALEDVVDRVQQNTSTNFTVVAWPQYAKPQTGTKVFFEVRNKSAEPLNLSMFKTELEGWASTNYVCNPTAGSDADVAKLTIGPNAKVRCHLVLKAPTAFLADDQPDLSHGDPDVINPNDSDPRYSGPFGSLAVTARSNGTKQETLAVWGEAPVFDVGESGTGTGTFQVHGVGPVPWDIELRAEDGFDNLNNSSFNWIRGNHDDWVIQIDVTWDPRNRTSESFQLVDRSHSQDGRTTWISIEYPGENDTIVWPNVVELNAWSNPRTWVQQGMHIPSGFWVPGSTRFKMADDVAVGDVIVGAVDEDVFPEGARHRVDSIDAQGWFRLEDEPVEMIEIFRQVDIDTSNAPAIETVPVNVDLTRRVLNSLASQAASRFDFTRSEISVEGSFTTATTTRSHIVDFWRPQVAEAWTTIDYGVGGNVTTDFVLVGGSSSTQLSAIDKVSFQLYPLEKTDPFYEVPKINVPIWAEPPIILTINPQVSVELAFELSGGLQTAFEFTSEGDWTTKYNPDTGEWEGDYELSKLSQIADVVGTGDFGWLHEQTVFGGNAFAVEVGLEFEADVSIQPLWALAEGTIAFNPKMRIEGERAFGQAGTVERYFVPGFEIGAEFLDGLNMLQRLLDKGSWAEWLYRQLNVSPWVRQFFESVIDQEYDLVTLTAGEDAYLYYRTWEWPWGCNSPSCLVDPGGGGQGKSIPLNNVGSNIYSIAFDTNQTDVHSIDVAVAIGRWSGVTNIWVDFANGGGRYVQHADFDSTTWNNGADGRVVFDPPLQDVVGFTLYTETGSYQALEEIVCCCVE